MPVALNRPAYVVLALAVLCYFLYCFGNGSLSLTDPDDVFYADSAKEMLDQGSFLTPIMFGQPQFEKPPLYYWLLMVVFDQIGVTAWTARFVGALFGILSVLLTYLFVRRLTDQKSGIVTALILATTIWWIGLARVVLTDLIFSVFIMLSLYAFYEWYASKRNGWLVAFAAGAALATLAKGPLGLALPLVVAIVFMAVMQDWKAIRGFLVHYWWLFFLAIGLPWYLYATLNYGDTFLNEFFVHDHWDRFLIAEHAEFDKWYFYPGMMLVSFLPWTAYLPFAFASIRKQHTLMVFALVWLLAMTVLLAIPHSKLATYISPVYPALALLLANGLHRHKPTRRRRVIGAILLLASGTALIAAIIIAPRYVPDLAVGVAVSAGVLAASTIVAAGFVLTSRVSGAIVISAAGVLAFVILSTQLVFPHLETSLTQAELPAVVNQENYQGKPILCSSIFARGIYFYSGNPVVIMSDRAKPFWSEHPVPVLSSDSQITQFLSSRDSVLCVVNPRELRRLNQLTSQMGTIDTVSRAMDKTVALYRSRESTPKMR